MKLTKTILHCAVGQQALRHQQLHIGALTLASDVKRAAVRSADAPDEAGELQGDNAGQRNNGS